ncbi:MULTISPECIES: SRPBCC domain-containing protein [unclassified Frankia]|uniref:SRPBCC domain-containing protein n=1 Tax=unclassified Frankia TaxID=2632575 RepID=UPI002AD34509|nr:MULTISPECIES: SRPBCC domain-containing protein [unclassified Frankia]
MSSSAPVTSPRRPCSPTGCSARGWTSTDLCHTFDHGVHGSLPARIEKVDRPRQLSYRWSQGDAGTEPTDGNATLVEFTLDPVAEGTVLRVVESGFNSLSDLSAETVYARRAANLQNWPGKLDFLRLRVEQFVG